MNRICGLPLLPQGVLFNRPLQAGRPENPLKAVKSKFVCVYACACNLLRSKGERSAVKSGKKKKEEEQIRKVIAEEGKV